MKIFTEIDNKIAIHSLKVAIESLKDDIKSLRNLVNANYVDFANYAQSAPKGSEQWTEQRLRALEHTLKCVMRVQEESGIGPCTDNYS